MIIKGTVRGKTIELLDILPFTDGQQLSLSIAPETDDAPFGSPQALLKVLREPPHLNPADVDELKRLIAEGGSRGSRLN